jgi:hypothetical protein
MKAQDRINVIFERWYNKYTAEHPEYDGFNDSAIDAFWAATDEAGFSLDDVYKGLDAMERVIAVKEITLRHVIEYVEQINSNVDWSATHIFADIQLLKSKLEARK